MAFALIGNNFSITTPTYAPGMVTGQEEEANSKARANWLSALWRSWSVVGQKDAYFDLVFNQVVRGKSVLQVAWIKGDGPLEPWRPPVLFRSLNPKNVGYLHDDVNLVVAYHTYDESIRKLKLRYPEIVGLEEVRNKDQSTVVTFTDYWYKDPKSKKVYNAFLINNREYLRAPKLSKLPLIPMVIRIGQEYQLDQPADRVSSFIEDLIPEWELENEIESMMVTGLKESFWNPKYVRNKNGEPVKELVTGPGAINEVDPTFEFVNEPQGQRQPDFMSANLLATRTHDRVQRTSFADSLFGLSDAGIRSSIMIHHLTQAGMSHLGSIVQAVGRTMMEANSIALCMAKKFNAKELTLYAFDAENNKMRGYSLRPEQIHDSYENHVLIKPAPNTSDDLQRLSIGIQLFVNKILSGQTVREALIPFRVPDDEKERILREMAEMDPDVIREMIAKQFEAYFGYPLPRGEPDFAKTPQQPDPSMQPPQAMPGLNLPPEMQGQISPEMMTGDANVDPMMLDMMQGQPIDPRQAMPPMM